ncbi:branched-chain amino acid ABC transporter permease [Bradyrhizobium canariense]|uniref:Amino acid/amide ABC transporter membrane protein 2, HAAT family n=1 Tax=Bradyrhizobium canariense TaxID=255045 RepID=A0A1H1SKA4_9BRAD|nr:high-affinity branched-chain amino acid ABC transporter permease LivM [Bradyrhizobium canariense]SDS47779.1 amino acid/amide ABC transporter membrane protein 2, HAAT family [Bradyrhizobium canariense]
MTELRSSPDPVSSSIAAGLLGSPFGASSRFASIFFAGTVLFGAYALVICGLRLADSAMLIGYVAGVALLCVCWYFAANRFAFMREVLVRERGFLIVGVVLCAMSYPFLADGPYQVHVMAMAGIFALMALGLNVNIGYAGLADFGFIAYYAIGAYASAIFSTRLGVSFWLCVPLAGLFAAALSLLVSFPALRVKGHYLALVTLGFAFIVIQLITNLEGLTGGTQGISGIASPSLFGHSFRAPIKLAGITLPYQANFYYLVLACLVLGALVCARLGRSRWGRAWAAMRNDEIAAEASGLSLTKLKLLAFGTGACLGGIAGSLYAHMIGYLDPSSFRFIESVFLLAVVVLGNFRIAGVIAAAVVFTVLPEKLRAFDDWRLLIFGLALLGIMLVRGRRMISTSH